MSLAILSRAVAAAAVLCVSVACGRASDTGEPDVAEPAGGVVTRWTDSTELFMEHPALIVGQAGKFAVHLTDITDFAPLRSGSVTLRFLPRGGGAPLSVTQETPRAPGIYGPAPVFTTPGVYDLVILVDSPQAKDSLFIEALTVYASAAAAPTEADEGETLISFLKEQQWKTPGFATAFAAEGSIEEVMDVPGEVFPAAGRVAVVSAPISGLIDAAGIAATPAAGSRVSSGQVLAYLVPALGETGSAYAEARARLRDAEAELTRVTQLFAAEAVPQRRVQEAETRLQAARESLSGLAGGRLTGDGRLAVTAPIGGIVVQRAVAPGARVEAGTTLFTLVDPREVWVEARVPAAMTARIRGVRSGTWRAEGDDRMRGSKRVVATGAMIDSISRTLSVTLAFDNAAGALQIGATGRVALGLGRSVRGVLLPTAAVLEEDGRPIAYVQVDGEGFQKRALTLGGSNGTASLVLTGLRAGERVVTGAAYQVRLASLSTSVPAEGHAH